MKIFEKIKQKLFPPKNRIVYGHDIIERLYFSDIDNDYIIRSQRCYYKGIDDCWINLTTRSIPSKIRRSELKQFFDFHKQFLLNCEYVKSKVGNKIDTSLGCFEKENGVWRSGDYRRVHQDIVNWLNGF